VQGSSGKKEKTIQRGQKVREAESGIHRIFTLEKGVKVCVRGSGKEKGRSRNFGERMKKNLVRKMCTTKKKTGAEFENQTPGREAKKN